ncbi:hypothetical protein CPLU01_09579 [Colletotrichum plurivorum]|uniref:Uncharacterized protein n=1 Tax=Colletotrichum plurivorum TaxID=2175906 RepID=A0A8H6K919_9PEZI|nr:hypothetical protein CPLU01_09579 [Colletotrichum plurivorum]
MSFSYDKCSQLPPSLEPYGDISGLGVMLGFVISAWLTILILVAFYIFSFDPNTDPFQATRKANSNDNQYSHKSNPVDLLIFTYAQYLRPKNMERFKGRSVETAFHKCILSLADTQLITGLSILASGYWSLTHDSGMSAYHWKMVVSLAWFSGIAHLSALTFLRGYFAKHTSGRLWRLSFMFLLLVLLFVGLIPTGHFEFLGGAVEMTEDIDLGSSIYPTDCSGFFGNETRYYFPMSKEFGSSSIYYTDDANEQKVNITTKVVKSFNLGLAGPKLCNISGKSVLRPEVSFDQIDFNQMKYLRLLRNSSSSEWDSTTERFRHRVILYESPAACFFKGGMNRRSEAFVTMLSSLLLLVYSYLIRAAKVFERPSTFLSVFVHDGLDNIYTKILERWHRRLRRSKNKGFIVIATVALPFQTSVFYTIKIFIHLYTSMFAEVYYSVRSLDLNKLTKVSGLLSGIVCSLGHTDAEDDERSRRDP